MTTQHRKAPRQQLLAVLVLFAFLVTACGNGVAESTAERSADTAPESAESDAGVAYGATIDEWAEEARAPAVLEPKPVQSAPTHGQEPTIAAIPTDSFIAWDDLIPPGASGQEIVDRFAERLDAAQPGSDEATAIYDELKAAFDPEAVNTELDGQEIRLAGFVAPLTYDEDIVTEFLLVPNFGACIHVPPPPPNQTIMVTVDKSDGLTIDEAWGAVWVEGTIVIEASTSSLAPASYRIDNATSGVYSGI